ncbi:MAG: glycoside hydrolase family 3 N-terminal domain-containing protein [Hyphomicrobiaceae bacterium]
MRSAIRKGSEMLTWAAAAGLGLLWLNASLARQPAPTDLMSLGMAPAGPHQARTADLDHMIGQMLVVGFYGQSASDGFTRKILGQVRDGRIGGVILMDQNIRSRDQLERLTSALHAADPPLPLLIAIDQEGGAVQRLGPKQGVPRLPGAARLARQGSLERATELYAGLATELKTLGINLNLGPVVDLARNPRSRIIVRQGRSFGTDPGTVAAFAEAFIRAHRRAGVLTAAKHFPGHGSTAADSHRGLIDLTESWSESELEPYRMLVGSEPPPIVMVGHLHLDRFDADAKIPATLSKEAIESMLRGEIGYQGAVITDDLEMGAIRRTYKTEDAAVLAIAAGNDLVLISNTRRPDPFLPERLLAKVRAAVLDGTIPRRRIEDAYHRIVALKRMLAVPEPVLAGPR